MVETKTVDTVATIVGGTISEVTIIGSTVDIKILSSAIALPTDAQFVYQLAAVAWSSTNITSTATWLNSDATDISTYITKTAAIYSSTCSGTMRIQTTPTSSTATWYTYYTDNSIIANTYTIKSFTDAQYWARLGFTSSITGTLDGWIIRQVG